MREYSVSVREILEREILIEADSMQEAQSKVEEMYNKAEIILTADDYKSTELDAREVIKEKVKYIKGVDVGSLEIGKSATIIGSAGEIIKTSPLTDYFVAGRDIYIKTINNSFYTTDKSMIKTGQIKNNNSCNKKKEDIPKIF